MRASRSSASPGSACRSAASCPCTARARLLPWAVILVLIPCWTARMAAGQPTHVSGTSGRKNILLLLTDDQDYLLGSAGARVMPSLDKFLRKSGLELPQFIVPGCPSRASLLTGRHCHNTNITSNSAARGGAVQFLERGLDSDYLPVWLQAAGYSTYLVGQFLNGFNRSVLQQYGCPQGWTAADVLVQVDDPMGDGSGDGDGAGDGSGQDVPAFGCAGADGIVTYTGRYHEELIREKVTQRIDEAAALDQPFFMMVATVAPRDAGRAATAYPEVMPEYRSLFLNERAPRLADWGVPVPPEIGFTSQRPNNFNAADIDARFRARLQALRAVDDTLALILRRLACHELLDDTVVVFSSDSGFKLGSHNLAQDKSTYFEEDVRVPLLMAGPGVPVGVYAAEVTAAAVDLTATITYLAGIVSEPGNTTLDGAVLPLDLISAAYPGPNQPGVNTTAARERPVCDSPVPRRQRSPPPPPSPRPPALRPRPPFPRRVDPPPRASPPPPLLPPRPRLRSPSPPSPQPPAPPNPPRRRPASPPPAAPPPVVPPPASQPPAVPPPPQPRPPRPDRLRPSPPSPPSPPPPRRPRPSPPSAVSAPPPAVLPLPPSPRPPGRPRPSPPSPPGPRLPLGSRPPRPPRPPPTLSPTLPDPSPPPQAPPSPRPPTSPPPPPPLRRSPAIRKPPTRRPPSPRAKPPVHGSLPPRLSPLPPKPAEANPPAPSGHSPPPGLTTPPHPPAPPPGAPSPRPPRPPPPPPPSPRPPSPPSQPPVSLPPSSPPRTQPPLRRSPPTRRPPQRRPPKPPSPVPPVPLPPPPPRPPVPVPPHPSPRPPFPSPSPPPPTPPVPIPPRPPLPSSPVPSPPQPSPRPPTPKPPVPSPPPPPHPSPNPPPPSPPTPSPPHPSPRPPQPIPPSPSQLSPSSLPPSPAPAVSHPAPPLTVPPAPRPPQPLTMSPSPAGVPAASPPSPPTVSPSPSQQLPLPPRPLQPPGTRRPPRPPPPPPPVNLTASGRRLMEQASEASAVKEEGSGGGAKTGDAGAQPGTRLGNQPTGGASARESAVSSFLAFVRPWYQWGRIARGDACVHGMHGATQDSGSVVGAEVHQAAGDAIATSGPGGEKMVEEEEQEMEEKAEEQQEEEGPSRRARLQQQAAAQGNAREPLPYYGMWSNVRTLESWLDMATPSRASKNFRAVRACSTFMGYGPPVMVPRAGNATCFKYIVFCNPANVDTLGTIRMLFDLGRDPTELVNLYKQPMDELASRLVDRLDALLSVTAYCEGGLCRNPFRAIHIDGSINNLHQAMDPKFDLLYASFDKFSYRRCAPYYHPENEKADRRLVPTHIRKWVAKT